MKHYDNYLRWLDRGGHPNRFARLQNRTTAIAFAVRILPKRAAALEIRGRERYLVSMLGNNANWVRNLKAADGRAVLRHGRHESVHLEEVDPSVRAPILRRYLQVAPAPALISRSTGGLLWQSSGGSLRTTPFSASTPTQLDTWGSTARGVATGARTQNVLSGRRVTRLPITVRHEPLARLTHRSRR